jgi:hypothetical protein
MKRHNVIMAILFALVFAKGAGGQTAAPAPQTPSGVDAKDDDANLNEVQALLEQLNNAHALEVDENGNVRVKPSIIEKLKHDGRMQMAPASFGSICT